MYRCNGWYRTVFDDNIINDNFLRGTGSDVGVDGKTTKEWLSILEASSVIFKLSPYFENFGKRVIKSPKYYFIDTGLLSYLLGMEKPEQVTRDPLVGQLLENMIVLDALKTRYKTGALSKFVFLSR